MFAHQAKKKRRLLNPALTTSTDAPLALSTSGGSASPSSSGSASPSSASPSSGSSSSALAPDETDELLAYQAEDAAARLHAREALLAQLDGGDDKSGDGDWRTKARELMTSRDWRLFREHHRIKASGHGTVPTPLRSWSEAELPDDLLAAVKRAGYAAPTPVQMQCIPIGLAGADLLASAETGSGKTAAFLLPIVARLQRKRQQAEEVEGGGPLGLILAPTRELAQQIAGEAEKLGVYSGLQFRCVTGGTNLDEQVAQLHRHAYDVLIGTPGRVLDLLVQQYVVLERCAWLVLDEADRMIDEGFAPQLNAVMSYLPERAERVTAMFSATLPPPILSLARRLLRSPLRVAIGRVGKPVSSVEQKIVWIHDAKAKPAALLRAVQQQRSGQTVVFANTKLAVDEVCDYLNRAGLAAVAMHSGKSQEQREAALQAFKDGRYAVLVSTDLTGRGIDIPSIRHVVQYDVAKNIEDYTHRVGRTGRAGSHGHATAFVSDADLHIMNGLLRLLRQAAMPVPRELLDHPAAHVPYETYLTYHRQAAQPEPAIE